MEELKDIKPAFEVTDEAVDNMGCIFAFELRAQGIERLYTEEQMQEYAKAQAKKVFWYAAKGTSEDRLLLARAIDYAFKEAQDEEV